MLQNADVVAEVFSCLSLKEQKAFRSVARRTINGFSHTVHLALIRCDVGTTEPTGDDDGMPSVNSRWFPVNKLPYDGEVDLWVGRSSASSGMPQCRIEGHTPHPFSVWVSGTSFAGLQRLTREMQLARYQDPALGAVSHCVDFPS